MLYSYFQFVQQGPASYNYEESLTTLRWDIVTLYMGETDVVHLQAHRNLPSDFSHEDVACALLYYSTLLKRPRDLRYFKRNFSRSSDMLTERRISKTNRKLTKILKTPCFENFKKKSLGKYLMLYDTRVKNGSLCNDVTRHSLRRYGLGYPMFIW